MGFPQFNKTRPSVCIELVGFAKNARVNWLCIFDERIDDLEKFRTQICVGPDRFEKSFELPIAQQSHIRKLRRFVRTFLEPLRGDDETVRRT